MRIILEPTDSEQQNRPLDLQHRKIVIECHGDDHTLYEVLDELVTPALKAWGYVFGGLDKYEAGE